VGDDHLPPGEGRIDWEMILRELVGIEFRGAGNSGDGWLGECGSYDG
jgi:hypothetical protein